MKHDNRGKSRCKDCADLIHEGGNVYRCGSQTKKNPPIIHDPRSIEHWHNCECINSNTKSKP